MSTENDTNEVIAVVLAAGKGTRMNSDRPKVVMEANGRPLIDYVIDALEAAGIQRKLIVVGYKADMVREALAGRAGVEFVEQTEQLGTGHAVMVCREQLESHQGGVLIVTGDSPMIQVDSIAALLDRFRSDRPACLLGTLKKDDPTGLGRIVRDDSGAFVGIVEHKDATDEQRKINEVNMSTYVFDTQSMLQSFAELTNDNRQQEYYVTDCPGILLKVGHSVEALPVLKPCEALSVNNLEELADVELELQRISKS